MGFNGGSQRYIKYTAKRQIDPGQDLIKLCLAVNSSVAVTSKGSRIFGKTCAIFLKNRVLSRIVMVNVSYKLLLVNPLLLCHLIPLPAGLTLSCLKCVNLYS